MNQPSDDLLMAFTLGPKIADRWSAARDLMAARQLVSVTDTKKFDAGFRAVGEIAEFGTGSDRLVAIDLIVRLSKFVKKLVPLARDILENALKQELPSVSLLGETESLPKGAKPAEFRENVARALHHATGEWVIPYVLRALVDEDRSQRCRVELARQLVARDKSIDQWMSWIIEMPLGQIIRPEGNLENSTLRLRGIASALADAIRENRIKLSVSENVGPKLAEFCRLLVPIKPNERLPKQLGSAAAEVARLLDEIFAVKLTLIVEPDTYAVLDRVERWWQPLPYPKPLKDALAPITDKLVTGITLRARWGQKSESLAARLKQSFGGKDVAAGRLNQIAQDEPGITAEIGDWLRGRRRSEIEGGSGLVGSLRAVSDENVTNSIAALLLDAEEALNAIGNTGRDDIAHHTRRLCQSVRSLAAQRGLEVVGKELDVVEYLPVNHQTISGEAPADAWVEIVRPMVVRRRRDASEDIVIRAVVKEKRSKVEK